MKMPLLLIFLRGIKIVLEDSVQLEEKNVIGYHIFQYPSNNDLVNA
jgi:hypothetical protein